MEKSELIQSQLKELPQSPGIYYFYNKDNEVLYVGKSKSLRQRVRSYFSGRKEGKLEKLVKSIHHLSYEAFPTHLEACLQECFKIKEIQPLYNAQYKRNPNLVSLSFGRGPKEKVMKVIAGSAGEVGPFRQRHLLEDLMERFTKIYPISYDGDFHFEYHVLAKRPTAESYERHRQSLLQLFSDSQKMKSFIKVLEKKRDESAGQERFGQAIYFRDFVEDMERLEHHWRRDLKYFNEDLFFRIRGEAEETFFHVKQGLILDRQTYPNKEASHRFLKFIDSKEAVLTCPWASDDLRRQWDFWSIMYSEIRTLGPESVYNRQGEPIDIPLENPSLAQTEEIDLIESSETKRGGCCKIA